jgi:alkanesulfonate monooxygenase SsuD/methylene tetrahydromethanopterin reductase-like flavin-dependent oxidoreductase (luciferase family)
MMEHDTRYEYASEWVEIVLKLWTEQWFDYRGEFLTINQGSPIRSPTKSRGRS